MDYQPPYDPYSQQMNNGLPQANYNQVPDPSFMMGQNYMQQTQYFANMSQNNLQQTMQIAQYNFHQHMQATLQGTMQAAMAIYNPIANTMQKGNERIYNDIQLGGGAYALERGFGRELAWGSGLAESGLGRALRIGGRRPEFLSNGEYAFQMHRAVHHGQEELMDMLIGGGASTAGSIAGMAFGPPGIVAGTAFGMALDATVGVALKPYLQRRKFNREFRQFSEMADLNHGYGQRRLDDSGSEELSNWMYGHDVSAVSYIPLIGKSLNKRLSPDTKYEDTFKSMLQNGLFRDSNVNDIEGIKKQVTDTVSIVEKYAGILHTTKEAIMKMKGTFNRLGMNQNIGMGELSIASLSTGLVADQLLPLQQSYAQSGFAYGFNKDIAGASGLRNLSNTMAGIEGGLIDRMFDPGSFSQSLYSKSVGFSQTGYGKVIRHGMGNVGGAAGYYANHGGGNTAVGYMMEGLPWLNDSQSSLDVYGNAVNDIAKKFGRNDKGLAIAMSVMGAQSPEEKVQVYNAFYGIDKVSAIMAKGAAEKELINRTGHGVSSVVNLANVHNTEVTGAGGLSAISNAITAMKSAKKFTDSEWKERDLYTNTSSKYSSDLKNLYGSYIGGGAGSEQLRSSIMQKLKSDSLVSGQFGGIKDEKERDKAIGEMADRIINNSMSDQDERQSGFSATSKAGLNAIFGTTLNTRRNATLEKAYDVAAGKSAQLFTNFASKNKDYAKYIDDPSTRYGVEKIASKLSGLDPTKLVNLANTDYNALQRYLKDNGAIDSIQIGSPQYDLNDLNRLGAGAISLQDQAQLQQHNEIIAAVIKTTSGFTGNAGNDAAYANWLDKVANTKHLDKNFINSEVLSLNKHLNMISNMSLKDAKQFFNKYGSGMLSTLKTTHTSDSMANQLYDNMLSGISSEDSFKHFKESIKSGLYQTTSDADDMAASKALGLGNSEMLEAVKSFTTTMNQLNVALGGHA